MAEIDPILLKLDQLISLSRLKEIAFIVSTDLTERISKMAVVPKQLRPGAYLLGTGPSTVGIIPLTVDEVVLGRSATVLEEPTDAVIDYAAADTTYFVPREVSRTHAKVIRRTTDSDVEYVVADLKSTCGTFVNGTRVDPDGEGVCAVTRRCSISRTITGQHVHVLHGQRNTKLMKRIYRLINTHGGWLLK